VERGADPTIASAEARHPWWPHLPMATSRSCASCSAYLASRPPSTAAVKRAGRRCGGPASEDVGGWRGCCSRAGPTLPSPTRTAPPPWPSPSGIMVLISPRAVRSALRRWRWASLPSFPAPALVISWLRSASCPLCGWQEAERAYLLWKARQVADQQGSGAVVVGGDGQGEEGEAKEALLGLRGARTEGGPVHGPDGLYGFGGRGACVGSVPVFAKFVPASPLPPQGRPRRGNPCLIM
jgi:hypothetical protein